MRGKKNYLLLAALLPLSLLTKANGDNGNRKSTEPVLQGCVADAATKKPVQGVTISISTSKGQEKKEFTTDASGNFKVPQMPVGEVIIILEKKGYNQLESLNGEEALVIAECYPGIIHVQDTELVIDRVNGPELVQRLLPHRPAMQVNMMYG